jgi:hypothetical protein
MGAGVSLIPERVDKQLAQQLAGPNWDETAFDDLASSEDGSISKTELLAAAPSSAGGRSRSAQVVPCDDVSTEGPGGQDQVQSENGRLVLTTATLLEFYAEHGVTEDQAWKKIDVSKLQAPELVVRLSIYKTIDALGVADTVSILKQHYGSAPATTLLPTTELCVKAPDGSCHVLHCLPEDSFASVKAELCARTQRDKTDAALLQLFVAGVEQGPRANADCGAAVVADVDRPGSDMAEEPSVCHDHHTLGSSGMPSELFLLEITRERLDELNGQIMGAARDTDIEV